jgi:hypothetical protein
VTDRQLADRGADPVAQGGQKAMHFPIKGHILENFPAVDLECAPIVVEVDPGYARDEPVGDLGGQPAGPEGVLAIVTPPTHDVVAIL